MTPSPYPLTAYTGQRVLYLGLILPSGRTRKGTKIYSYLLPWPASYGNLATFRVCID